ncbi:MAG: methyl-accepting chemotaxis protein [Rectinemataceae bacterium]
MLEEISTESLRFRFAAVRRSTSGPELGAEAVLGGGSLAKTANIEKDGKSIGTVTVVYDFNSVKSDLLHLLVSTILQTTITAAIQSIVIAFSVSSLIIKPLRFLGEEIDSIAEGEADLTRSIAIARRDEIGVIVGQSRLLREANETIASIASLTNLLAMNAAIEAAHAGDAGRSSSSSPHLEIPEPPSLRSQKTSATPSPSCTKSSMP